MNRHQIELLVRVLTVQRIFHLFCDGQYLRISVEALVMPVPNIARSAIRALANRLVEIIYRISCTLST
jgi:hypothetical protein